MKIIITLFLYFILSHSAFSEEIKDTSNAHNVGVSVGMVLKPSLFKNGFGLLTGAKLGLTINENYYAGFALYGITFLQYKPDVIDLPDTTILYPNLELSYYGLEFEYDFNPKSLISPSILIFGGFYVNSFNIPNTIIKSNNYNPDYKESTNSFILEPAFNLNLHLKSFYVVNLGVSYRYFFGIDKTYQTLTRADKSQFIMNNSELNGVSVNICIRFGSF
jgi:hypothetical protein